MPSCGPWKTTRTRPSWGGCCFAASTRRGRLVGPPLPAQPLRCSLLAAHYRTPLDWSDDAASLARRVRAMAPTPGAFGTLDGEPLRILAARVEAGETGRAPGTVRNDGQAPLAIATGSGWLAPTRLQRAGGRAARSRSPRGPGTPMVSTGRIAIRGRASAAPESNNAHTTPRLAFPRTARACHRAKGGSNSPWVC